MIKQVKINKAIRELSELASSIRNEAEQLDHMERKFVNGIVERLGRLRNQKRITRERLRDIQHTLADLGIES